MPTVTVRLFAQLREHLGADSVRAEVSAGTTLDALRRELLADSPLLDLPVAYARNHSYATGSERIEDGDELAFLPPVGGG